jgi:transmembrane sensor
VVSRIVADAEHDSVLQEAAQWSLELSSGEIPAERIAQWQQWLAASEEHRTAFDRIQSTLKALDPSTTGIVAWPSDAEVASDAYDGRSPSPTGSACGDEASQSSPQLAHGWLGRRRCECGRAGGLASHAIPAARAAGGDCRRNRLRRESRCAAERRLGRQCRGTVDALGDAHSRLREVTLERGEAFFRVAKDPAGPFVVKVGTTTVAAVGTAFNVRRAGERVVIGVAEGIVKVHAHVGRTVERQAHQQGTAISSARLSVGQQLSIDGADDSTSIQAVDASGVAAWRKGRFQYRNEPLRSVMADLARNSGREIVIANPQIADVLITGTVFASDVDSWLQSLETALPVRVVLAPDGSVRLESR